MLYILISNSCCWEPCTGPCWAQLAFTQNIKDPLWQLMCRLSHLVRS